MQEERDDRIVPLTTEFCKTNSEIGFLTPLIAKVGHYSYCRLSRWSTARYDTALLSGSARAAPRRPDTRVRRVRVHGQEHRPGHRLDRPSLRVGYGVQGVVRWRLRRGRIGNGAPLRYPRRAVDVRQDLARRGPAWHVVLRRVVLHRPSRVQRDGHVLSYVSEADPGHEEVTIHLREADTVWCVTGWVACMALCVYVCRRMCGWVGIG